MIAAVRITLITAVLTAVLAAFKLGAGYYGASHALFADGLHSLSDVLIDVLVLFAAHYGDKQADSNHPYGHGRIETAATFGLALILILTGISIMIDAGKHIWGGEPIPKPDQYVLWIALLAVVLNELVFRYTLKAAKKINSQLLEANAWHSRSDAAVSVVVLLSIAGALMGFNWLDAVGAVFVGVMIGKMGATLAWKSIAELVDTGVDNALLADIQKAITDVEGVAALHQLRTRTINNAIFLDVHILVAPRISVSEGHFIGEQVIRVLKQLPDLADITVHVDPEDDEIIQPSVDLPTREAVMLLIKTQCSHLPFPEKILLHYLGGKIEIEMIVKQQYSDQNQNIAALYQEALKGQIFIRRIYVYFTDTAYDAE